MSRELDRDRSCNTRNGKAALYVSVVLPWLFASAFGACQTRPLSLSNSPTVQQTRELSSPAEALVAQLKNDDISWDGTPFGIMPSLSGETASRVLEMGPSANAALEAALHDPAKFAVAHVLLSFINRIDFDLSAGEWDGLGVTLAATGQSYVYPEQIPELVTLWKKRLHGT